ncbi:MAG: LLM class flavin-dependent oxidoreductase [Alphaproteobacteria bacterium]
MRFQIAINLERCDASVDMQMMRDHVLEMVQMADRAGFGVVWAAEHHALEMTIAPNPMQLLTWWAAHTDNIRLGCGVANASYWHPINLAGEAAMVDLISGGRLDMGLGSGAYQREFDRMKPGLKQTDSWRYMQEMLPLVRALWEGDVEHNGEYWQFPTATSCPKPLQNDVPMWVAARAPITFDYAVENRCNIMSWPLTRDFSEAELYKSRLDEAMEKSSSDFKPNFAMMRHTSVYEDDAGRQNALDAVRGCLGQFENLMRQTGEVKNGFPERMPLESLEGREQYEPNMLEENLMFGRPDDVINKLKRYEDLGVDSFIYYASMGLDMPSAKKSLKLFCDEVMPAFA